MPARAPRGEGNPFWFVARGTVRPLSCGVIEFSLLTAALSVLGCGRPPVRPSNQQVTAILAKGAPFSQDFFYECVLNEYAQGIPLKQIQEDCEIKLAENDKKGFGNEDLFGPFARNSAWFDPAKVTAACNAGDPKRAAGKGKSVVDGAGNIQYNFWDGRQVDYGRYSWGGKDQCDSNGCYQGLSEEESARLKNEAVLKAKQAYEDYLAAKQVAAKDPKNKAKQAEAKQKDQEAKDAEDEAKRDPNKVDRVVVNVEKNDEPKPAGDFNAPDGGTAVARPVGGESPCDQALQAAREVLGECMRSGWRSPDCQSLAAKMNGCPDPSLIYVDPDAGYTCRQTIDPKTIKDAWVARCQELMRPVPGGPDPCEPPSVDQLGRYIGTRNPNVQCKNPYALYDPGQSDCYAELTIQDTAPNLQKLYVWALNKFGGPIVVFPTKADDGGRPPTGGPKPDPLPKP